MHNKYIYIIIISIIIILINLTRISPIFEHLTEKETPILESNSPENIKKYVNDVVSNTVESGLKLGGPPGPPGPPGPAGKRGQTGGNFIKSGFLSNVSDPTFVLDRTFGLGENTKGFLNKKNYLSNQIWSLKSNNTLENQYGGCLSGSKTDDVFIDKCANKKNMQWFYNNTGQIVYVDNNNLCLSLNNSDIVANIYKINGKDGQWVDKSNLKNHKTIFLEKCDKTNLDQRWFFN